MSTVSADELSKSETPGGETDEMAQKDANERVPDSSLASLLPQKGVSAKTGILHSTCPLRYMVNSVCEHPTRVVDSFPECPPASLRAGFPLEDQWVPAADTNIFVMTISLTRKPVEMSAEETAQCMSDTSVPVVGEKIFGAAAASGSAGTGHQFPVIHLVAEQNTLDLLKQSREFSR
jgi:hypothetical protein